MGQREGIRNGWKKRKKDERRSDKGNERGSKGKEREQFEDNKMEREQEF